MQMARLFIIVILQQISAGRALTATYKAHICTDNLLLHGYTFNENVGARK